jgi:hypothetical protein
MTPQDEQTIRDWALREPASAAIVMARGADEAGERLAAFCDRFKALVPGVQIRNAPEETYRAPALIIGRHANIAYQAVPEGKELPPFLDALSAAAKASEPLQPYPALSALPAPVELMLFISMQCPHCPQAVQRLIGLAESSARVRLAIVDGVLFEQEAKARGIRSVPTLILEDQVRWIGRIDMREVIDQCVRRDPAQLSAGSLRRMLEAGEAEQAAALMISTDQIFPALLELLTNERWSVRLGAMVTMEYLTDMAPGLAGRVVEPLWERFGELPEPVQGDVVHVLGQVASAQAASCLHRIAEGDFAESVKQAAAEELE